MPATIHIHAWAVKSANGIALKLDRASADLAAAQHHGIVVQLSSHDATARALAAEKIAEDLDTYAAPIKLDGQRWWDTRPMVDAREQPAECVDMAVQALDYAISAGLLVTHPDMPHVVRWSA